MNYLGTKVRHRVTGFTGMVIAAKERIGRVPIYRVRSDRPRGPAAEKWFERSEFDTQEEYDKLMEKAAAAEKAAERKTVVVPRPNVAQVVVVVRSVSRVDQAIPEPAGLCAQKVYYEVALDAEDKSFVVLRFDNPNQANLFVPGRSYSAEFFPLAYHTPPGNYNRPKDEECRQET